MSAWKKPHDIVTLSFSEVFFQVEGQATYQGHKYTDRYNYYLIHVQTLLKDTSNNSVFSGNSWGKAVKLAWSQDTFTVSGSFRTTFVEHLQYVGQVASIR